MGLLLVSAIGVGYASKWSLLGLLNVLDAAHGNGSAERAARDVAFGDDPDQKLNIWKPAKTAGKAPVLIFLYGGSWRMGGREYYDFLGRAFANQGFVVVIPTYRLVPKVRFPEFVEDAAAAVAWTRLNISKHGGDPNQIAISGHSAGAQIAALVALDPQWLKKAGAPPETIRGLIGMSGPYDFLPFTTDASKAAFGHVPNPEITQPITYARKDAPPMLLLTGTNDVTVKPRNTEALAKAQRNLGTLVEVKLYPGLNHTDPIKAIGRPFRDTAPIVEDMTAFLKNRMTPLDKGAAPQ